MVVVVVVVVWPRKIAWRAAQRRRARRLASWTTLPKSKEGHREEDE